MAETEPQLVVINCASIACDFSSIAIYLLTAVCKIGGGTSRQLTVVAAAANDDYDDDDGVDNRPIFQPAPSNITASPPSPGE